MSSGFPPSYLNPHSVASCSKGDWLLLQLHFNVTPTIAFTISCRFSCFVLSVSEGNPSFQNVFKRVIRSLGQRLSNSPSEATRHKSPGITSNKSERPFAGYKLQEIDTVTLSAPLPTWKGTLLGREVVNTPFFDITQRFPCFLVSRLFIPKNVETTITNVIKIHFVVRSHWNGAESTAS